MLLPLALLIALGFTWGSGYSLAKYAITHGVPPLGYSFWQALGPALLIGLTCLIAKPANLINKAHWPYFFICGLLGIAIPNTNMYFIASYIPAGLLAVVVNTVPLLVYPMALFFGQERYDFWRMLALLLGMMGILMIIAPQTTSIFSEKTLLALISPFSFACCSIFITAKQPAKLAALEAAGMLLAASLLLTPLVIQQKVFILLTPPWNFTQFIVLLEIGLSSIGYLLFFKLITIAGPVFYSLTGSMVALTGLFWGFIIFHERLTAYQLLAIAIILCALFLLSWRQKRG